MDSDSIVCANFAVGLVAGIIAALMRWIGPVEAALIHLGPEVFRAEMAGAAETGRQIRATGPLPNVPLVVLSRGKSPVGESDREQMWTALQRDLVNESPRGTHIIARQSGHYIQKDEPELVIQTIRDLVMQARQGRTVP